MQDRARGNPKIEFILDSTVDEVIGTKEGGITSLKIRNLKTNAVTDFATQGLFVAIGHTPNTQAYAGQLELDSRGYICLKHPHSTATNIEGVFACGDAVDHVYRQAVTAAGTGCMAALDCEKWLTHERITERWDLPEGEEKSGVVSAVAPRVRMSGCFEMPRSKLKRSAQPDNARSKRPRAAFSFQRVSAIRRR